MWMGYCVAGHSNLTVIRAFVYFNVLLMINSHQEIFKNYINHFFNEVASFQNFACSLKFHVIPILVTHDLKGIFLNRWASKNKLLFTLVEINNTWFSHWAVTGYLTCQMDHHHLGSDRIRIARLYRNVKHIYCSAWNMWYKASRKLSSSKENEIITQIILQSRLCENCLSQNKVLMFVRTIVFRHLV